MDSVVGTDLTLPVDINGSCGLPDSIDAGEYSLDSMTAPSFPDKMSPIKALTMKDYENQITALKKENFNLKLRIYFMEERMQQKCDDSTEDIFKTNIELKVELESMKRDLAEKQELLVSASKALESLAGRESGEPQRVREQARREMDALRDAFNKRITDLEQSLQTAEQEVDKMAAIAEQEKLRNINMEKKLQALGPSSTFNPVPVPVHDLQQALQEKNNIIEQLQITLKNQEAVIHQKQSADQAGDAPSADRVKQLSDLIAKKDQEFEALRDELHRQKDKTTPDLQSEVRRVESCNKQLTEELTQIRSTNEDLSKTLEEIQNQNKTLLGRLEEKENELNSEKKNALKRDKTIQGLTQVFKEKENQIAELCHEIEDRDDALAKAREAAHKAQLQKYQGVEEHQNLLMATQTELAQLQGDHHAKLLEAQKLQRGLDRKEQELVDLLQAKDQLEVELEDLQQQKKKGDKALNDLNNQLKKLSGEIGDRESALEQQYQELLDQTKRKLQTHEVTIQRLTSTLADKEQQLQEYMNMVGDFEQSKSPGGNDNVLSKLRHRLKEKEKALEQALDEKFAAIEEKDNEIHQLQLSLREKERDLDRLNNLISHNEETLNSFDSMIKEKDVELQHLANTLKNLQRAKQDVEDNLNRSLREKDSIISQLQLSLEGKTKDMEEMAELTLSQSQTHTRDLAEQMGQRLKVTEAMLAEAVKARERLVADNESAVEGLLATISSKDQLMKESAEHYNRMLSERSQEILQLKKQLSDMQQQLVTAEKQSSTSAQKGYLELAELRALLAEKDGIINKLVQSGQVREERQKEEPDHVFELRQTIQILQEKLDEAELSRPSSEDNAEIILTSKKTVVILKKELAQKTEALNKALKRENELKISLRELQSLLSELEGRCEGQAANIESLTSTLKTKDEIIDDLHQRLGQGGDSRAKHTQDQVIGSSLERSLPGLPQRERTIIGGDSQQEALPKLVALQQEKDALNIALRAEQQLYSSLVRTVKEQDSAQRLHALQLELTAVQLLRQQLEEDIRTNEELRDDLEKEIHRAKLREGMERIDPKELQSMRHQLEDAQRWNASLQARLGAIQNRGGGVGGANDGDTLSFIGDQTSYMSICVVDGQDDGLALLSAQELRQKVHELQDCGSRLQTENDELQKRLSLLERSDGDAHDDEKKAVASSSSLKQQEQRAQEMSPVAHINRTHHSGQDKESQTDIKLGQMVSGKMLGDVSMDSGLGLIREHARSVNNTLDSGGRDSRQRNTDAMALKSLLTHCGDRLIRQYVEALQAAESTIAYLTACSLDSQGRFGSSASSGSDSAIHSRCVELQKALQEKEELNNQLLELLDLAGKAITSSNSQERMPGISDLCLKIETALQEVSPSSKRERPRGGSASTEDSMQELQRHSDSLQEALWQQNRLNAELQEKLRAADAAAQHDHNNDQEGERWRQVAERSLQERESPEREGGMGSCINPEITTVLMKCLGSAESAVSSLAAHCTNAGCRAPEGSSQSNLEFQMNLDKLQRALQERRELGAAAQSEPGGGLSPDGQLPRGLHSNLCRLYKVFNDHHQRICDLQASLQEDRGRREESEVHRTPQDAKGLPPGVQVELETLHKALREKRKACKSLEEKLATALTSPETARKALEQDDKGVQVDLQDLGYETSGKSENDREESSSTDLEVGVNPSCSASCLPSRHEQATFSSTENLDSTSSTPYPSSPALSSAKVSLKSLQVYDEYGASKDPLQLQAQVRELKVQLENQTKLILQMQGLLRRTSVCSDLVANASDPSPVKDQEDTRPEGRSQDRSYRSGRLGEKKEGETPAMNDRGSSLDMDLERERTLNRSTSEQHQQNRSGSTSPARLDSLVQSQARELSHLRQQMKESRGLGALQRRQLDELSKAFKELLQAGEVDYYVGEAVQEQLDKSLGILDRLEGRLGKGESRVVNEDAVALELSLRLTKELQEKNRLIQSLQGQLRSQGSVSQHSSHSDLCHSDRTSCHSSSTTQSGLQAESQQHLSDWTGADVGGAHAVSRLRGLRRENGRLQDQLRGSEELNTTLRSELDLHQSIMAQTGRRHQEQAQDQDASAPRTRRREGDVGSHKNAAEQPRSMDADSLAEHLQEIRVLRQRLEESINTNDRLREQLEKRLAEVEKDPAATNIFIHGNEEQGQLANEVRLLWGQNKVLNDQLSLVSKDKQKEREKLRETLARRTAKLEQSRRECAALMQENNQLQERLQHSSQANSHLQESVHRLQCEVKLQVQQLSDSQHLLQSLRVELQVYEKIKNEAHKQNESSEASRGLASGSVDLSELLSEIRHLRLQLERSIQTNTALRQRLEEQLLRGPNRSETININYLLSSPDEGGRSPGREGCDLLRQSFQSHSEHAGVLPDETGRAHSEEVGGSFSSSSGESVSSAPPRLVPGHRMWANRNGRHILGLIEDYNALRKQISEGRRLSRCMDKQLQESLHALKEQASDNKEQQHLKGLSGSVSSMQHVLEEAGRMLKLVWRVSLPAGHTAGGVASNQQDELLKNEIARLKSRLSQQERMLSGAVKRLRTTNQLKEGMERVIIDQLHLTHGVLKKARGNLETNYCSLFGPGEGDSAQWPVGGAQEPRPQWMSVLVPRGAAGRHSVL
ncbi:CDK5 regulatory subunit-associated protein 2 [Pungitius pungitius]|uniref:CDK5 regulatory subunit-associated protein 2 n=1 Tax=Pungitius pungitius TaxID=134920 RepID=UPI002E11624C